MSNHSIIEHRAILCWKCGGRFTEPGELCRYCRYDVMNKIIRQKKRARVKGNEATLTTAQWVKKLYDSQGYCHYCHKHIGYSALTLEHLIPVANGGGTTAENCVPACMACNWNSWVGRARI
jgi:5-methylcytosine-specific restriction endonuclease McrA